MRKRRRLTDVELTLMREGRATGKRAVMGAIVGSGRIGLHLTLDRYVDQA